MAVVCVFLGNNVKFPHCICPTDRGKRSRVADVDGEKRFFLGALGRNILQGITISCSKLIKADE